MSAPNSRPPCPDGTRSLYLGAYPHIPPGADPPDVDLLGRSVQWRFSSPENTPECADGVTPTVR